MEDKRLTSIIFNQLYHYLIGTEISISDMNLFRKNHNKLEKGGDVSFPLSTSAWQRFETENMRELIDESTRESGIAKLIVNSEDWEISIQKIQVENNAKLNIFFERPVLFRKSIEYILLKGSEYGYSGNIANKKLEFRSEHNESDLSKVDLTQLRINLLKGVAENLVKFNTCNSDEAVTNEIVFLTNRSQSDFDYKIVCGVVIGNKFGKKNTLVSAEEFYCKRTMDMRLMAEHKYGVRVNTEPGWKEFLEKLGTAAVTFDLLHGKSSKNLVINIDNPTSAPSKGASFVLYNCARLAEIFKQFENKVALNIYPPLPDINEVDFSLLTEPEEWEILYVYLVHYPEVIRVCLKDLFQYNLSTHNLCTFLDSLCLLFSVYYRRIRILTDVRDHLIGVLHSRIYLLKAVQQVLYNTLAILNIPLVRQM